MTVVPDLGVPFVYAQVARLTADHLTLLSRVDQVAESLKAGLAIEDAVTELRRMAATARGAS
ncbi:hypothetical protein [Paracoccus chinensis]|uniref:Uncharacterized protein n=1 Tax=Paracoccus chinensis TaxID=525640 RepID=A0A1G9JG02_9RHOB|nr:hypothetical protein [Paracoccus chinensis]SDL36388.1 hypothetical protein SAMN04487971_109118 [Paracoccus chinensis]